MPRPLTKNDNPAGSASKEGDEKDEVRLSIPVMQATIAEFCKESAILRLKWAEDITQVVWGAFWLVYYFGHRDSKKQITELVQIVNINLVRAFVDKKYLSEKNSLFLSAFFTFFVSTAISYSIGFTGARLRRYRADRDLYESLQKLQHDSELSTNYQEIKKLLGKSTKILQSERNVLAYQRKWAGLMLFVLLNIFAKLIYVYRYQNIQETYFALLSLSLVAVGYVNYYLFWRLGRQKKKQDKEIYNAVTALLHDLPGIRCDFAQHNSILTSIFTISFPDIASYYDEITFSINHYEVTIRYKDIYKNILNFIENTHIFTIMNFDKEFIVLDSTMKRPITASDRQYFFDSLVYRHQLLKAKFYFSERLNNIFKPVHCEWKILEIDTAEGEQCLQCILNLQNKPESEYPQFLTIVKNLLNNDAMYISIKYGELSFLLRKEMIQQEISLLRKNTDAARLAIEKNFLMANSNKSANDNQANNKDNDNSEKSAAKSNAGAVKPPKRDKREKEDHEKSKSEEKESIALPRSITTPKIKGIALWPDHPYFKYEDPECELIPLRFKNNNNSHLSTHFFCYIDKHLSNEFSTKNHRDKIFNILLKGIIVSGAAFEQGYTRWQKNYKNCRRVKHTSFYKVKDPEENARAMVRIDDDHTRKEVLLCADGLHLKAHRRRFMLGGN